MKCHLCGGTMESVVTDLPFKVSNNSIVIVKSIPAHQCGACGEHLLEDPIMERLESILRETGKDSELSVVRFAA